MKKIDWLIIISIVLLSLFALKDLFKPGFFTSHDGPHQIVRFYYFVQALADGQIPPRWASGLLHGFGYPLFIFSYHLPWFIAEAIHSIGFSIIDSVKYTFLVGFMLSGFTMYIFQKEIFGRFPAVVGTFLYLFAPFRFLNIFVRAAIGDATVFIFAPLLGLSLYKIRIINGISWKWIFLGSISLASILLSHAMVFVFYSIFFGLYIIYTLLTAKNGNKSLISFFLMIFLCIGISSYYLIPSFIEKDYTKVAELMKPSSIGTSYVDLSSLLYSKWGFGTITSKEGSMSLQVGIAQLLAVVTAAILIIKQKIFIDHKAAAYKTNEAFFYLIFFILSIFLMLSISRPVWGFINNFFVVDFTWRVMSLTIMAISILAGFSIRKNKIGYLLGIVFIIVAVYANRNHLRINQSLDWPLEFYLKLERTTNSFDEYTPKWVNLSQIKENQPKIEIADKNATLEILKLKSNSTEFKVDASGDTNVRINTIYYPGWRLYVDNNEIQIDKNPSSYIEFSVPAGNHEVKLQFQDTPLRLFANFITMLSVIILISGFIFFKKI